MLVYKIYFLINNSFKSITGLACFLLLITGNNALASVTCTKNVNSISVSGGTISVQRDKSVGESFSNVLSGNMQEVASCSIKNNDSFYINLESAIPNSTKTPIFGNKAVFSTGVNGVGLIMGVSGGLSDPGRTGYYIRSGNNTINLTGLWNSGSGGPYPIYIQNLFQFIKTEQPMLSGNISGRVANVVLRQGTVNGPILLTIPVNLTATVKVLACSVSSSNVTVPLDTVFADTFNAVGSTKGDSLFTVGLSCDAGARINATMNFTQDEDTADNSVIALTGKGNPDVATGVGIQLLYGSTPLKNNTNVVLKTSEGGQEFPPGAFTARYFQTQKTVKPGSANATATMTLTYQ
ncbi:fimbrial protein [Winslowiella sp. 2C04]|uniref:fimbrial protein n=1 Tax=Winslowiella sp. 2C04 TaxID=3416179 RepID=UPI003CEDE625